MLLIGLIGTLARHRNACGTWNICADKTMDLELPKDFREFLRLLRGRGVEYLLIGGWAVGYHGYPRSTDDLDVWIAVSHVNAEKVVTVFKEVGSMFPNCLPICFLRTIALSESELSPFASRS